MYGEDLDLGQPANLDLMDFYLLRVPAGTVVDGAVVELASRRPGTVNAEVRIPAHQPERM